MSTGLREHTELLMARMQRLTEAVIQSYLDYKAAYGYDGSLDISLDIVPGIKYYKLVLHNNGTSVHAFVQKQTGALHKAASWKAPAKHVRYNLLDDVSFETCLKKADWAGSYLYL